MPRVFELAVERAAQALQFFGVAKFGRLGRFVELRRIGAIARAAVAVGISGLFMETHPCPEKAWSDGPNSWPLDRMESLLGTLLALDKAVKSAGFEELK